MKRQSVVKRAVILLLSSLALNFLASIDPELIHAQVSEPRLADGRIDYLAKLNQLLREDVTPETNAAVVLLEVLGEKVINGIDQSAFLTELGLDHFPKNTQSFVDLDEFAAHLGFSPGSSEYEAWNDAINQSSKGPWTAEQRPDVARWIEANEPSIADVIKASQLPRYCCPLFPFEKTDADSNVRVIEVSLEIGQKTRGLTRYLVIRSMKELGSRNTEAAIRDIQAIRRLAALQTQSLTYVEGWLAVAISRQAYFSEVELLGSGQMTLEQCEAYRGFLRNHDLKLQFPERIESAERFMFLDAVQMVPSGKVLDFEIPWDPSDLDLKLLEARATNYAKIAEVWRNSNERERIMNLQKIEMELTDEVQRRHTPEVYAEAATSRSVRSRLVADALFGILMPNCNALAQAEIHTKIDQDLLEIAFAIECYRLKTERFPDSLDVLTPDYLPRIPSDRFTNKPLVYRPAPAGYVLYSVGKNLRDDGGETINDVNDADDWQIQIRLKAID